MTIKSFKLSIIQLVVIIVITHFSKLLSQETEIMYLSGTGNDQTVEWEFLCTEGNQSGEWKTIPVPSNWELQGFGTYNYGHDKDTLRGKESGLYRYQFRVPGDWRDRKINMLIDRIEKLS